MRRLALLLLVALPVLADNPAITIHVDAGANRHAIDPRIYGSSWATATEISTLGLTLNRWGGNAMSRYNWIYSTANRCKDYYFFNIPDNVSSGDGSNGKSADDFIDLTFGAGAEPVMTIPMLSLLPKDRSKRCSFPGTVLGQEQYITDEITCGNGRMADGDPNAEGPRIIGAADPNNISTSYPLSHQGDWIQHMIDTHGSATAGGVRHYSLDNEPHLWSFDHWDVHPTGTTYDEVWEKMRDLGAIIRAKDPGAIITGGEEWGWTGYFDSGIDAENGNSDDRDAHGGAHWYDWMLDQFQQYEIDNGERILDVLTVHFYPQGGEFWSGSTTTEMQELRNRSTRALWDPDYTDESWMSCCYGGKVKLIPRLKEWVANHYPGTQIGITEYNWGDINHINGATTQADILGIFGREDLDVGVRWDTPDVDTFIANAFRMYRNYDGAGSKFGDTSVSATVPDPDAVSAFASERTADGKLTIMLIAKTLTDATPVTVQLANFTAASGIERWELDSNNAITQLANLAPVGNAITLTLPAQSITLLVVTEVPPPALTATATGTSSVSLTWTAVAGAASYEIERSFNGSAFAPLITVGTTSHTDSGLTANTTYLYKVRAVGGALSAIDPATTIVFTDPTLTAGMTIKAAHFNQLRTAVNAMRASAGLAPYVFTDTLNSAMVIKAIHLTELRSALDEARSTIGLTGLTYSNNGVVKAAHVNELRNGVK